MHIVETSYLLANILCKHNARVSFKELRDIRERIEIKCSSVAVDMSYASVSSAVENYPMMFCFHQDTVARTEGSDEFFASDDDSFIHEIYPCCKGCLYCRIFSPSHKRLP